MSGIMLPAPGTLAAVDRGCTCTVVTNGFAHPEGRRTTITPRSCPLHGVVKHAPTDNGEARSASPARLPGDAWGNR